MNRVPSAWRLTASHLFKNFLSCYDVDRIEMLCTYCSNIDLGQCRTEEGYKHHLNYFHMRKAADQGCKLCELIASKFDKWITKMQWCDNYLGGAGWYWEDAVDSRIVIRSEISANNLESFSIQPLKNFGSFDIYFASTEGKSENHINFLNLGFLADFRR